MTAARPKQYIKGPDMMSKSKRTQERYARAWKSQTSLDRFGFQSRAVMKVMTPAITKKHVRPVPVPEHSATPSQSGYESAAESGAPVLTIPHTRSVSMLTEPSDNEMVDSRQADEVA
jgi:hypothetical protein